MKIKMSNYLWVIIFLFAQFNLKAKDTLSLEHLRPYTYNFKIDNSEIDGPGKQVLLEAIQASSIVMLGNHSRSKNEYDFSKSLVHLLGGLDFGESILGVGPASAEVIKFYLEKEDDPLKIFKLLNNKYKIPAGDRNYTSIPEFKSIEAGEYFRELLQNNMSFSSVGVDVWTSYKMILNENYIRYNDGMKDELKDLHESSMRLLDSLYLNIEQQDNDNLHDFTSTLNSSKVFGTYMEALSKYESLNSMLEALNFSIDYWTMYGEKKFFLKNKLSAQRNKRLLKEWTDANDINYASDKIFITMWRQLQAKGFTANGFYGIGNTLNELAEFNGNSSLNISLLQRYFDDNGEIIDRSESLGHFSKVFKDFVPLGQKDIWTLIDLRSFNEDFHWGNYEYEKFFENVFRRYDMIIIPSIDSATKSNF